MNSISNMLLRWIIKWNISLFNQLNDRKMLKNFIWLCKFGLVNSTELCMYRIHLKQGTFYFMLVIRNPRAWWCCNCKLMTSLAIPLRDYWIFANVLHSTWQKYTTIHFLFSIYHRSKWCKVPLIAIACNGNPYLNLPKLHPDIDPISWFTSLLFS